MNISSIILVAEAAISAGNRMTLVVPSPFKNRPKGFPRGDLLCEQPQSKVMSYDPHKILTFLNKNDLYQQKGEKK